MQLMKCKQKMRGPPNDWTFCVRVAWTAHTALPASVCFMLYDVVTTNEVNLAVGPAIQVMTQYTALCYPMESKRRQKENFREF